jgi:hypothetical protein
MRPSLLFHLASGIFPPLLPLPTLTGVAAFGVFRLPCCRRCYKTLVMSLTLPENKPVF